MKLFLVTLFVLGMLMQSGISIPQMISFGYYDFNNIIPEAYAQEAPFVYRGEIFEDIDYKNGRHFQTLSLPRYIDNGITGNGNGIFGNSVQYVPYRIFDKPDYITYETGTVSWTFNKLSCTAKLYNTGHVSTNEEPMIESMSWTMQKFTNNSWQNTIHNTMPCNVIITELPDNVVSLVARQGDSSIDSKEIEFRQKGGEDLEVFMRSPVSDGITKYGFNESHIKTQDIIHGDKQFGLGISQEHKLLKSEFRNSEGKDIPVIVTKPNHDNLLIDLKDSIHNALTDATVKKYSADKLQISYDFHQTEIMPAGQRLEIDPTYSSNNPTIDGSARTTSTTGTSCGSPNDFNTSSSGIAVSVPDSDDSDLCQRLFFEFDISSIPDSSTITDSDISLEVFDNLSPKNCDVRTMSARPSTDTATNVWNAIGSGTALFSNDTFCTTNGVKNLDLGTDGDSYFTSKLASDWGSFGVKLTDETRDSTSAHYSLFYMEEGTGTDPYLEITYTVPVCTAPTSLGTTVISTTQIDLSWTAPSPECTVTGYKIERESPVGGGWSTIVADTGTSTTSYSNTSLSSGTEYNYRVSAINASGTSAVSNTSSKFTITTAPTALTATAVSPTQIDLSWTAPSGTVTGYKIERESPVGGGWSTIVADTGTTTTTYSNTLLTTNTVYNYRVSAINLGGTSAASTADDAKTFGVADPPTGLAVATISTSQLNLSWVAPSWTGGYSIIGYKIERESPTGGGFSTLVNDTGVVTSYSNTGLTAGTQYNYILYTWNSQGLSSATSAVANYTLTNAPTSLTATPTTGTNINLSWTAPSGTVTGYKIERESPIGGGFSTIVANTGTTTTTYSNSGLTTNTQYNYRVSAINLGGTSAVSNQANATTFNYPSPPLNLAASTSTPTSISLNWDPPADDGGSAITGYKIERESPIAGGFSTIVNNTGTTTTGYTDSPLSSGTQYNYRVSAWNAAGGSSPSNQDDATTFINIVGFSEFTKSIIGDSMKVTHTTTITTASPNPTITSIKLYKDGALVQTFATAQVIPSSSSYTFSPYWYRITDSSSHNYNVQAVTSQWNGTKLLNSTNQAATIEYAPDYFTSEEGSIQVNYTTQRLDNGETLQIKINRDTVSPTWNIQCKVRDTLFDDGTWINVTGVGYYNETTDVQRTKNAYITCYTNPLLFTTTSFGTGNATTSLVDFTSQLGSFFGVPIPFMFVIFLAAIFTGRSAPTGAIFIAGTLGTMGAMGYFLDPDGTSDNMITVAIWGMILLLTAMAVFVGKRYL